VFLQKAFPSQAIHLRINRNRVSYLNVQKTQSELKISVHQIFLQGGDEAWSLLRRFCGRATRKVRRELDYFIENIDPEIWKTVTRSRPGICRYRGRHHDLLELLKETLALSAFEKELEVSLQVAWGRHRPVGRNLLLGSYDFSGQLIRIHPLLDHGQVPKKYLMALLHHETLHALYRPCFDEKKRRRVHTKAFREEERRFPYYEWARSWEKKSLDAIIKSYRQR
jgi:hypothetical protein